MAVSGSDVIVESHGVTSSKQESTQTVVLHSSKVIKSPEPYIAYDSENVTIPSGITVNEMYELLKSTGFCSWDNAQAFVDAEKLSPSVNAIFLLGVAKQESLHGRSGLAKQDNNIFSYRLDSGKYKHFNSVAQCIHETSELLSKKYLIVGTKYYNGFSVEEISKLYCEGTWAEPVNNLACQAQREGNKLRNL